MTQRPFQDRVRECFGELIELEPIDREAALEVLAAESQALADEVRSLLNAHASAGGFLNAPEDDLAERLNRAADADRDLTAPPDLDGFHIERPLGRGNFGEVWLATQLAPFEREVAIKLLAFSRLSATGRARFEHEVRALARMEHPSVARVFEIGVADDGRPWFSMEVVRGAPLTAWCDERRASLEERLALLEQVCLAAHHAHRLGLLHRDLKPSNVLVAEVDGEPLPKVIDFGLSVIADQELETSAPQRSLSFGTPLYMAPEQADLDVEVDTRADVYGLGGLLCELLSGEPPVDLSAADRGSLSALLSAVRTAPRRLPSAILSSAGTDRAPRAARRRATPARLQRAFASGLDAIVARATAVDPCARYEGPLELARDLRAYLERRPIAAREGGAAYALGCLIRRHAAIAALTAAVVLASLGSGAVALRSTLISRAADAAAHDSALASEEVGRLLQRLILAPHPDMLGRDVTMLEVLRAAEEELAQDPPDRPLTEARLRSALGNAFLGLGDPERAATELSRALELLEGLPEPLVGDLASNRRQLGRALIELGRPEEARALLAAALTGPQAPDAGSDQELGLQLVLGMALKEQGNVSESVERWSRVADLGIVALGADHVDVLSARLLIAQEHVASEPPEAVAEEIEAVVADHLARFGETHPRTQSARAALGVLRERQGRLDEAEALFQSVLETRTARLGERHPRTLDALDSLASTVRFQGRGAEALELVRRALEIRTDKLGPDHPTTLKTRSNVASLLAESGRAEESAAEFLVVYEKQREVAGDDHPDTLGYLTNLANALDMSGRSGEARPLHRRAYEGKLALHGAEHPNTLSSMANLASNLTYAGEFEEARELIDRLIEIRERLLGPGHPSSTNSRQLLGVLLTRTGETAGGAQQFVEAYRASRAAMGAGHPQTGRLLANARRFLTQAGDRAAADALGVEHAEALASRQ